MKVLRLLSRLVCYAALIALTLDGLLLAVDLSAQVPVLSVLPEPPRLSTLDSHDVLAWTPIIGWVLAFWIFVWVLTRGRYQSPDALPAFENPSATSPYARAIPRHGDLVDLLSGVPGSGARDVAATLRKGPHNTTAKREEAEKDAAHWEAGAEAEQRAARLLKALGPDWTVLHDITVHHRGWNLDHVAIGPQGVFVINTKTTSSPTIVADGDQLIIHGWHTDYLTQSRREAFRTAMALFGTVARDKVTPVVLFVNTPPIEFRSPPGDVWITEAHNIVDALTGGPVRLTPKQYGRLVAKARYQQTWIDGWERAQRASRSRHKTHPESRPVTAKGSG